MKRGRKKSKIPFKVRSKIYSKRRRDKNIANGTCQNDGRPLVFLEIFKDGKLVEKKMMSRCASCFAYQKKSYHNKRAANKGE